MVISFWSNRTLFFGRFVQKSSKQLHTIQNDEDHVSKKIKSCFFISIRYPRTSQSQDVKSQSTKRNLRELAQPKHDSAFEQKTRIVPSREISGSSQNSFCSYSQKKQSWAQTDFFGTHWTSFWKVCVFFGEIVQYFSEGLDKNRQKNCTKYKTTKTTFPKKSKVV